MLHASPPVCSYYDTQRDIITIVVLLIIFASVVYFCVVFFSEVWVTFRGPAKASKKGRKGKGSMRRLSSGKDTEMPRLRVRRVWCMPVPRRTRVAHGDWCLTLVPRGC